MLRENHPSSSTINLPVAAAAAGTLVLWSSAFVAIRIAAANGFGPIELTLGRFGIASLVLLAASWVSGTKRPPRREWKWLAIIGLIGVPVYHVALNTGLRTVDAGTVAMIIATAPVYTAAMAVAFLGERLRASGWIGIAISFSGALLIALGKGGQLQLDQGALLVLMAAALSAVWAVMQRPVAQRIGAMSLTTWSTTFGTALLLPWLPQLIETTNAAPLTGILAMLYLGIFPAAIANGLWSFALSRVPASRLVVFMYLMPPVTIGFAWLMQGDVPSMLALVGGAIAIVGVVVVNRSKGSTAARVAQQAVPTPAAGAGD